MWRMADRMSDGRLERLLREHRQAGMSWEAIASRLFADHGIEVTPQTLRMWGREIDTDQPEAAAS